MRWLLRVLLALLLLCWVLSLTYVLPRMDEYEDTGEPDDVEPPPAVYQQVVPAPTLSPGVTTGGPRVEAREPRRLRLWHYDAPVIPLLLTGSVLVPPPDPQVLGWWGRPAGSPHGVTLLTGHTVHDGGGTFDDLEDVPLGSMADLSGVTYEVVSVRVLSKETVAAEAPRLFSQTGVPRLVLVTCEDYDVGTGEYDSNVVVVLKPEG